MKNLFTKITLTLILCSTLLGCGSGQEDSNLPESPSAQTQTSQVPALATPLLSLTGSTNDIQSELNLLGKFEIIPTATADNANPGAARTQDLQIQYVPIDANNPQSGTNIQVIPTEGLHFDALAVGTYTFRITLFHRSQTQGDITIASIEKISDIAESINTAVSFADTQWRYDFDDDADGYANVSELMNGSWIPRPRAQNSLEWQFASTDPKDPNSHPSAIGVLNPGLIGVLAPDSTGAARVVGDVHSVPPGVQITVIHHHADGSTSSYNGFSRLDGSFDISVPNALQGDGIELSLATLPSLSTDPSFSITPTFSTPLTVHYNPVKVDSCRNLSTNALPDSGTVEIEGSGFGTVARDNEIIFPPFNEFGEGVPASDIVISAQTAQSTTLRVKIPAEAVSGYVMVHNVVTALGVGSYGLCDKSNPIVVTQKRGTLNFPDLFPVYVGVPTVALSGEPIVAEWVIVNQGPSSFTSSVPLEFYLSQAAVDSIIPNLDKLLFPDSFYYDVASSDSPTALQVSSIPLAGFVGPIPVPFNLISARGTVLNPGNYYVKIKVDPASNRYSTYGVVQELNENNNEKSSDIHSPLYLHSLDLQFEFLQNSSAALRMALNSDTFTDYPLVSDTHDLIPHFATPQNLDLNSTNSLQVQIGNLRNVGSYPLHYDSERNAYENQNPDNIENRDTFNLDPLNTLGSTYQDSLALSQTLEQANGSQDLKEGEAKRVVKEANDLNDQVYPIQTHLVYSKDCDLLINSGGETEDKVLDCEGCSVCRNRLEASNGGLSENSMFVNSIRLPLNNTQIATGTGCLFVLAEAVKTDSRRSKAERESYCSLPEEDAHARLDRKRLSTLEEDNASPVFLRDPSPQNNQIKIPIYTRAVDLVMDGFALNSASTNNVLLGDVLHLDFNGSNAGELGAVGVNLGFRLQSNTNVSSIYDYPSLGLGTLAPNASFTQSNYALNSPSTIEDLERIPLGSVKLIANLDPENTIYEQNRNYTGESNNQKEIGSLQITAPDVVVYGLGGALFNSCTSNSCSLSTDVGRGFAVDLYLKNQGSGIAKAPFYVAIGNSTSCLYSEVSSSTTPAYGAVAVAQDLAAGQILKLPLTVKVRNTLACLSSMSDATSRQRLNVLLDSTASGSLVAGSLGNLIERNESGVRNAEANNTLFGPRIFIDTTALDSTHAYAESDVQSGFRPIEAGAATTTATPDFNFDVQAIDLGVSSVLLRKTGATTDIAADSLLLSDRTYQLSYDFKNYGRAASGRVRIQTDLVPASGSPISLSSEEIDPIGNNSSTLQHRSVSITIPSRCNSFSDATNCLDERQTYSIRVTLSSAEALPQPDNTHADAASSVPFKLTHTELEFVEGSLELLEGSSAVGDLVTATDILSSCNTDLSRCAELVKRKQYTIKYRVRNKGSKAINHLNVVHNLLQRNSMTPSTETARFPLNVEALFVLGGDNRVNSLLINGGSETAPNEVTLLSRVTIPEASPSALIPEASFVYNIGTELNPLVTTTREYSEENVTNNDSHTLSNKMLNLRHVDFRPSALSSTPMTAGYSATLTYTLNNEGNLVDLSKAGPTSVAAYLVSGGTSTLISTPATVTSSGAHTLAVNIPATLSGPYTLSLDVSNALDNDASDNSVSLADQRVQFINLIPSVRITFPTSCGPDSRADCHIGVSGENITLNYGVQNAGTAAVTDVHYTLSITGPGISSGNTWDLHSAVGAGATVSGAQTFPIPTASFGTGFNVSLTVNTVAGDHVVETLTTDNTVSESFVTHVRPTATAGADIVRLACTDRLGFIPRGCLILPYDLTTGGTCTSAEDGAVTTQTWCKVGVDEMMREVCVPVPENTIRLRVDPSAVHKLACTTSTSSELFSISQKNVWIR